MPRKQVRVKRTNQLIPDDKYQSQLVQKLTKMLMKDGKYAKAYNIVCKALVHTYSKLEKRKADQSGKGAQGGENRLIVEMLQEVINCGPQVEIRSKRVGGANYPVPEAIDDKRKMVLLYRWLIRFARKRGEHTMWECLANEMLDLLAGRGNTAKKIQEVHSMAKANAAYAYVVRK